MPRPAKPQSKYKKKDQVKLYQVSINDKNCQSPKFFKSMCSDKNCQDEQCLNMQPVKSEKSSIMQLLKPAIPYKYRKLCSDQNCQSTRCYRKQSNYKKCKYISVGAMARTVNLPILCEI